MIGRPTVFNFNRTYAVAAHDVAIAAISYVLALMLRRGFDEFVEESLGFLWEGGILFTAVATLVLWRTRVYRSFWRYTTARDVVRVIQAASLIILIFLPLLFAFNRLEAYPRSALFINWFVLIALLLGPRLFVRLVVDGSLRGLLQKGPDTPRIPVLLLGAGDGAELFIRATARGSTANYKVVGIIDDDPAKIDRQIHGVRIHGNSDQIGYVVGKLRARGMHPQRLILTGEEAGPERLRSLLAQADEIGLPLSRLPRLTDFRGSDADKIEVRPIALEDLLGRPQTSLDRAAMADLVAGKRVCVTGAGGTIGAELVRQIAALRPAHLILFDNAEYNLYAIALELSEDHPVLPQSVVLGDVRDRDRLTSTFMAERPELVFHAAALKHVPMVEANPNEGVLTNVIGTRNVAEACVDAGTMVMVLISSDKAVNPTSVMGATKRLAESYCQALGRTTAGDGQLRVVTVRFGNVLGSSGSVIPLFQRQIAAGGPVTVTDPHVSRYFMTTREAVQLVLEASALGAAERGGEIYVLDMGEPIKIVDLARQMIRLAGLRPENDIEITFTGLRPGEKREEALFHAAEPLIATPIAGVLRASSRPADLALISRQIDQLAASAESQRTADTLSLMAAAVPEYRAGADGDASRRNALA